VLAERKTVGVFVFWRLRGHLGHTIVPIVSSETHSLWLSTVRAQAEKPLVRDRVRITI